MELSSPSVGAAGGVGWERHAKKTAAFSSLLLLRLVASASHRFALGRVVLVAKQTLQIAVEQSHQERETNARWDEVQQGRLKGEAQMKISVFTDAGGKVFNASISKWIA